MEDEDDFSLATNIGQRSRTAALVVFLAPKLLEMTVAREHAMAAERSVALSMSSLQKQAENFRSWQRNSYGEREPSSQLNLQAISSTLQPTLRVFCFDCSFSHSRTSFGPPAKWSRLYLAELSKQNARNLGCRVDEIACRFHSIICFVLA